MLLVFGGGIMKAVEGGAALMDSSGFLRRLLVWSVVLVLVACRAEAATPCAGDIDGDGVVSIEDVVSTVNAALGICAEVPSSGLLATGQVLCDVGDGTLGTCPGTPLGQDGAVLAGPALAYHDNGDGTVSDASTGLMWEKLAADASIHNSAQGYTWHDAFTVKIAALNSAPCFAGHCDWRLPNRRELESLVDVGHSSPATDPVFHTACMSGCTVTTCSCTKADYYWSSTSYQDSNLRGFAWNVDFDFGAVNAYEKTLPVYYVRAVRGGTLPVPVQ